MMINPGFAGQKLIPSMIRKIADTRRYLDTRSKDYVDILVDGNVNITNIPLMIEAGATILVGGTSSIFRKDHSIEESQAGMVCVTTQLYLTDCFIPLNLI